MTEDNNKQKLERPIRASDFPFTANKQCPKCGHKTPNLVTPPFYCAHCDASWTPPAEPSE